MIKTLYDFCTERKDDRLLIQWDRELNGDVTPQTISYGSHKKIWWQCEKGHHWQAAVYTRAGAGSGCPYCTGRKLSPDGGTLSSRFPDLVKQWHPSKNVGITPHDLSPSTHRKVWWQCEKGHEWQARVNSRTAGTGCPVCANRRICPGENDLASTHPELVAQWHPNKNGILTPQEVVAGNHRKVWWHCSLGHEWQSSILSRSSSGSGCPVCCGKQVVAGENDLASAFPDLAAQWHSTKNGTLTPQDVTASSNRKVWWQCAQGHEYAAVVAIRASSATDCPYCAGRKVLLGFNDLETKAPQVAAQWHSELNGTLTPRTVTAGSKKKVWWQCADGHVWKAVIYSRTGKQQAGCPVCAGKVKQSK